MKINTREQNVGQLTFRVFKNASIYGLGVILTKAGGLLIIPLYWSRLTPADFGIIAIYQIIFQFLLPLLDLGLSGGIQRHFHEWKKEDRAQHIGAVWSFSIAYSLIISLLFCIFAKPLMHIFFSNIENVEIIYYAIATGFFMNLAMVPTSLFRSREQLGYFSIYSMAQFLIQSGMILYFIFYMKMQSQGYILGQLWCSVLLGVICTIYMFRQAQFPWKKEHLSEVLKYSLPTTPASLMDGISTILDRFFLEKYADLATLGIYSLARQFGSAYNIFLQTMKTSWVPLTYRIVSEREDAPKVISKMSIYYTLILIPPALFISFLAREIIFLFNKPDYFQVASYIPFFVLGFLVFGIGHIYGRGLDLAKKTNLFWVVYFVYICASVLTLNILIPRYGVWGAIASFVISGIAREATQIGLAFKFYPRPLEVGQLFKILVSTACLCLLLYFIRIENVYLAIFVKSFVIVTGSIGIILLALGTQGFKNILKFNFLKSGAAV